MTPRRMLHHVLGSLAVAILSALGASPALAVDDQLSLKCPVAGFCYCVRPRFEGPLDSAVARLRQELADARAAGRLTGYLSVPLSSGGGASFAVNKAAAAGIRERLQKEIGAGSLLLIDPGATDVVVEGENASQGEYMYLWTRVISGEGALGSDLDFAYFAGPSDFWAFFASETPASDRVTSVGAFFDRRYQKDAKFKEDVDKGKLTRPEFVKHYTLRASAALSRGAHDEWNLLRAINARRIALPDTFGVTKQIPVYFNGGLIEPGDFGDEVAVGNAVTSCAR